MAAQPHGESTGRTISARTWALVAVALAVVAVACALAAWHFTSQVNQAAEQAEQQAQEAQWEEDHRSFPVDVALDIPGYDAATSTPVPVHVEGTDFEGNHVSVTAYLGTADSQPLTLMRGTYSAWVVASPFLDDGTLFDDVSTVCAFTVGEGGEASPKPAFSFAASYPETVTDDQIDRACECAADAGVSEERIALLRERAEQRRVDALGTIQAAEEEKAQVAEQEKRAARAHFETDSYTFDLPDYWIDRVDVVDEGTSVAIYAKGAPGEPLVRFTLVDTDQPLAGGDIGHALVFHAAASNGMRLEVRDTNMSYLAIMANYYRETGQGDQAERYAWLTDYVLDISTGGACASVAVMGADPKAGNATATHYYIIDHLVPTITMK